MPQRAGYNLIRIHQHYFKPDIMNKEIQDLAWSLLPKEFKEEVKRIWSVEVDCANKYKSEMHKNRTDLLYELFGEHLHWQNNLTSDAEGEVELLHVTRQKVIGLYANTKKLHNLYTSATCINEAESRAIDRTDGTMWVLKNLFGSKCLPDEEPQPKFYKGDRVKVITDCWKDNVYTVTDVKEIYPQFSYKLSCSPDNWFAESTLELAKEPKSFKYKVGQKVILHFYGGEVSTITEAFNDGGVWNKYKVKMLPTRVWNENELDPYEEPKPAEPESRLKNEGGGL